MSLKERGGGGTVKKGEKQSCIVFFFHGWIIRNIAVPIFVFILCVVHATYTAIVCLILGNNFHITWHITYQRAVSSCTKIVRQEQVCVLNHPQGLPAPSPPLCTIIFYSQN